jgi:hypothetical protein
VRGRVHDVHEWQLDGVLDVLVGGVDGVAGQQEEVGTRGLEPVGLFGEQLADEVPALLALVILDLGEVGLGQYEGAQCIPVAPRRWATSSLMVQ